MYGYDLSTVDEGYRLGNTEYSSAFDSSAANSSGVNSSALDSSADIDSSGMLENDTSAPKPRRRIADHFSLQAPDDGVEISAKMRSVSCSKSVGKKRQFNNVDSSPVIRAAAGGYMRETDDSSRHLDSKSRTHSGDTAADDNSDGSGSSGHVYEPSASAVVHSDSDRHGFFSQIQEAMLSSLEQIVRYCLFSS
jgi:hypothetical protein